MLKNWQEHSFVSYSIQKRKRLETMYKKYLRLLRNSYHNKYVHIITTRTQMLTLTHHNPFFWGLRAVNEVCKLTIYLTILCINGGSLQDT